MKKLLTLLYILLITFALAAQESPSEETGSSESRMEREAKEREAYEKTGFELYTYFPVSTHWPGWTWGVRKFEAGPAHIWLPTPNISFGLGMGWEADLGSRRPVLRRMGVGGVLEMSAVSGLNMKNGEGFGITMLYPYLYYTTDRGRKLDYSFKLGAGMAFVNGLEELFDSRQEKDNESGNVFSLEGDIIFASPGNWRFQAGAAYRFLVYNSRDIHIVTALIRAGYRF